MQQIEGADGARFGPHVEGTHQPRQQRQLRRREGSDALFRHGEIRPVEQRYAHTHTCIHTQTCART